MVASIKTLGDVRVGDTILGPIPRPRRCGYEDEADGLLRLLSATSAGAARRATSRPCARRWSASTSTTPASTRSSLRGLGFGFRCGFLGLLHMDIVQERIEREGGVEIVQTAPTVSYMIDLKDGSSVEIQNPRTCRTPTTSRDRETIVKLEMICPEDNIGDLMKLCDARRGIFKSAVP